jgi:hypothetical protein
MKLSEAIRVGATLQPQAFEDYYDGYGTCALGAAFEATFGMVDLLPRADIANLLYQRYPELVAQVPDPTAGLLISIEGVITDLNDHKRWIHEAFADWVEEIGY